MKTTVIHHSADFDGIFCREIAKHFLPDAELIGWDFADKPLDELLLSSENKIYVLDLPFDRPFGLEFKGGWICKGGEEKQPIDRWDSNNIVWIDHHKSSIETHPTSIPGYRIDGVAACRLAWQWFNRAENPAVEVQLVGLPEKQAYIDRKVSEPYAVQLAGEYDIWDHRNSDAKPFQFGLRSRPLSAFDWSQLLSTDTKLSLDEIEQLAAVGHQNLLNPDGTSTPAIVSGLLKDGRLLETYQRANDANIVNKLGFIVEFEGLQFLALNTTAKNSQAFDAKDVPETGHDALLKFCWNGSVWDCSMYHAKHRTELDLSTIAVKHGGGGHRGACGFRASKLPFIN